MGETMKNANFFLTSNYLLENDKIDNKEINELFHTYLNKIDISLVSQTIRNIKSSELTARKTKFITRKNELNTENTIKNIVPQFYDTEPIKNEDEDKDEIKMLDDKISYIDDEISYIDDEISYIDDEISYIAYISKNKIDEEKRDLQKIYIFGILPIEMMPSSYIPLNYKNHSRNLNRITKDDSFTDVDYNKVILSYNTKTEEDIGEQLKKILIYFNSDDSLHKMFNLNIFGIYIIFIWSFVIIMFMCILYYYYSEINYIFAFIVILYLFIAIIWKMIYTIQN